MKKKHKNWNRVCSSTITLLLKFIFIIELTSLTSCSQRIANYEKIEFIKETGERRINPKWRYVRRKGAKGLYPAAGLATLIGSASLLPTPIPLAIGLGTWFATSKLHKKYLKKQNLSNTFVKIDDYQKWIYSYEKEVNEPKWARKKYHLDEKKFSISRIDERNNYLYFLTPEEYFNAYSGKEVYFRDRGIISMKDILEKSFSRYDETFMLFYVKSQPLISNKAIFHSLPDEPFIKINANPLGNKSNSPVNELNGNFEVQYFDSNSISPFPSAYYAGEFVGGSPNGFGFYNFYPKKFHTNIIYRGMFKDGKFTDLDSAKIIAEKYLNESCTRKFINSKKTTIIESRLIRAELFPDYIDDRKYNKISISRYIKWKNNDDGSLDSMIFNYDKLDFFTAPLISNSIEINTVKGGGLIGLFGKFMSGKLSLGTDSTIKVGNLFKIVNIDTDNCNPRFTGTTTQWTQKPIVKSNVYTGENTTEYVNESYEIDNYEYDAYRKYKIQYRNSVSDNWIDFMYFNLIEIQGGEGSIDQMPGSRIIDRTNIKLSKIFADTHPELFQKANELYTKIYLFSDKFVSRVTLTSEISNFISEVFPSTLKSINEDKEIFNVPAKNEFVNQKFYALLDRIKSSNKFISSSKTSLKGVWLDIKNGQFYFIENENESFCKSLYINDLDENYNYMDYLRSHELKNFKENYLKNSFLKVSN